MRVVAGHAKVFSGSAIQRDLDPARHLADDARGTPAARVTYDSVVGGPHRPGRAGRGENDSKIHVVYKSEQLYPDFVVTYARDGSLGGSAAGATAAAESGATAAAAGTTRKRTAAANGAAAGAAAPQPKRAAAGGSSAAKNYELFDVCRKLPADEAVVTRLLAEGAEPDGFKVGGAVAVAQIAPIARHGDDERFRLARAGGEAGMGSGVRGAARGWWSGGESGAFPRATTARARRSEDSAFLSRPPPAPRTRARDDAPPPTADRRPRPIPLSRPWRVVEPRALLPRAVIVAPSSRPPFALLLPRPRALVPPPRCPSSAPRRCHRPRRTNLLA